MTQANLDGLEGDPEGEVDVENSSEESEAFIYDTEDISNDSSLLKDEVVCVQYHSKLTL